MMRYSTQRRTFLALLMLYLAVPATAGVVYVNQSAPGATHDGATWATAFLKVQEGLSAAKPGDEVWVATATYAENLTLPPAVALYGGFAGSESQRTQRDWTANASVIDGGYNTTEAVVTCGENAVVDGFTLRNGLHGVYALYATVAIANNVVTGNSGNGVFLFQGTGSVSGNTVIGNGGDGVGMSGGSTTLDRNTISMNGRHGVAVGSGAVTITNNTISGNGSNGATLAEGFDPTTLAGNTISGNGLDGVQSANYKLTLANNVVAFNVRYGVARTGGAIVSFSHNDVYGNTVGETSEFTVPAGQGNISLDPKLSHKYHNIHILPDSPCRDAGDNAAALGAQDIDAQSRIQRTRVDIGSDESDGTAWVTAPVIMRVSTTGSDANDGSSWAKARRTIASALTLGRSADEVWVAEGIYAERVTLPPGVALYGGFAGNETQRAQRDVSVRRTILDGEGSDTETLVTCPYPNIVVDGFTLRNARNGVFVASGVVRIANNVISGQKGAAVLSRNTYSLTATGNTVRDNYGGVVVEGGDLAVITNNNFVESGVPAAGVSSRLATVEANTFLACNTCVRVDTGCTASVRNNSIGHSYYGVMMRGGTASVTNNTTAYVEAGVALDGGTASITNNNLAFSTGYAIFRWSGTITSFSHNNVYASTTSHYYGYAPPTDAGNISHDPAFENKLTSEYRLKEGSPCIDAGDDAAVPPGTTDRDGKPRMIGPHVDMGAFEFGVPGLMPFTLADVRKALGIAGGLTPATATDITRLNVESSALLRINLPDAAQLARKVAGLEANP